MTSLERFIDNLIQINVKSCHSCSGLKWFLKAENVISYKRAYFAWMAVWWNAAIHWRSSHWICYICVNGDKLSAVLNLIWCLCCSPDLMSIHICLHQRMFEGNNRDVPIVLYFQNMLRASRYKFVFQGEYISSKSTTRPALKDYKTKVAFLEMIVIYWA